MTDTTAGEAELDLYDDKVQAGIAWTMRQWGEALGLTTWTQGDGSESVEGDVGAEIHGILVDAGLRDPETNEMATLAAQTSAGAEGEEIPWADREIESDGSGGCRYVTPHRRATPAQTDTGSLSSKRVDVREDGQNSDKPDTGAVGALREAVTAIIGPMVRSYACNSIFTNEERDAYTQKKVTELIAALSTANTQGGGS